MFTITVSILAVLLASACLLIVNTQKPATNGKIFQIGFDKCGTMSIASFFNDNGILSIHHDQGRLAESMYHNHLHNKPIISSQYLKYVVFTDMEKIDMQQPIDIGMMLFMELDKQYPGSKFILNTRNKDAWLKSRASSRRNKLSGDTLLHRTSKRMQISTDAVLALWSQDWDQHHAAVQAYFKDRPQDLLVFNIETDQPQKIVVFFKDQYSLDPLLYKHVNKTTNK